MAANAELIQQIIKETKKKPKNQFWLNLKKYKYLYLIILPSLLWYFLFWVLPLGGLVIAFKDFNPISGMWGSEWVGLKHFRDFITGFYFNRLIRNTLWINCLKLVFCFPFPIIFAILLNEIRNKYFKKVIQTFSYLPYFISWIVVSGFLESFLSPSNGIINKIIVLYGGESVYFMNTSSYFVPIVIITFLWKDFGWSSIIYLSAIASIDVELYEAAIVDGCKRFGQIWHITLPSLRPLMVLIVMLNIGNILNADFGQLLAFIGNNSALYEVGDVIDTFVYRTAMLNGSYDSSTAVGLFKGIISLIMILLANSIAKKFGEEGII